MKKDSHISWGIFILLCIIWGSSFKLMKDSSVGLSAVQIAALRIFSAAFIFVPFGIMYFKKIPKDKLGVVILSAVFGNLIPAFLFAAAMIKLDGSLGGILNSLTPISVIVVGILLFKTKVQTEKITGVLIGFLGLLLLILLPSFTGEKDISFENFSYSLLILLATLLYGINVNMVGKFLKGVHPIHAATVSLSFMIIPTALILWQQDFLSLNFSDSLIQKSISYTVLLGVLGSAIATALFYMLVKRAGVLFASLVTYGIPFIALLLGYIDGEKISAIKIGCLGIILFGVYLANKQESKTIEQ